MTKGAEVLSCKQVGERIRVQLSTGQAAEADLLVGSDGIRSRVRDVFDPLRREPAWSGYTCVAGMAYCTPGDLKEVGYKARHPPDLLSAPDCPSQPTTHPLPKAPTGASTRGGGSCR